jgi:hypothetical protein
MATTLDSKVPSGPLEKKWDKHRGESKLVAPNNRPKFDIIVVGSGLAGASAAATLGELGYNVQCFCFQDSPRRAHSIAAQGGINAAKNYQNDGDSVFRLFYDTIKGGRFSVARSECSSPGRDQSQYYRPMRGARSPICARVRRFAGKSFLWRSPGVENLLCPRPNRPAAAARSLSSP